MHDHLKQLATQWSKEFDKHLDDIAGLRKAIHQNPCVSGEEQPTTDLMREALGIDLEPIADTGAIGRVGPQDGPAVGIRGELDALPVTEETGVEWSSTSENVLQLVPSGPGYLTEPNLRMFVSMIHNAKERITLCSPYFVPEESLLEAITSACYRGVRVDLLVSAKSDQFMVHHAQSAYYEQLLKAGVRIWEFPAPFVLHTKFTLIDDHLPTSVAVVGSSNMDIRSFTLNYESSLFVASGSLLSMLSALGARYLAVSRELTLERWAQRPWYRRYIDNVLKLTSALQ